MNCLENALSVGTILKNGNRNYKIIKVLGAGGFGITYLVQCTANGEGQTTYCALKEYFPDKLCERGEGNTMSYLSTNALTVKSGIEDFITEAKRLNKQNISHPNIVSIDEVFKANGTAYYTMEYIEGTNLLQFIKGNHNKPLSIELALDIMRPIMQAVALLHKHKLTHLDIKHENIILSEESDGSYRPVLIDFGQAKHYDKKGNATSELTNAGCSDGFAPPEQYLGLSQFTPQADIYAICATLLYLLTAKQPIKSSEINASVITKMLPTDTPPYISNAIINGMRRDKDDRIQSIESLADSLKINLSEENNEGSLTVKLNIANKQRNRGRSISSKSAIRLLLICIISTIFVICGIVWYNRGSQYEVSYYKSGAIHYDNDLLKDLDGVQFFNKKKNMNIYHCWLSIIRSGHTFAFCGFFNSASGLDVYYFHPDAEVKRLKNEISLSDGKTTLKITARIGKEHQKAYNILYSTGGRTYEWIADKIQYDSNDFKGLAYENPACEKYTTIDFIESLLKRLKFKITYE
jgi:serine/threonine protein kinase